MRVLHSRPFLGQAEQRAVRRVVASGKLSGGQEVKAFEREVAAAMGRRYAVAVSSGTAALHLALLALGIGRGDRVALPSYACAALLHPVTLIGASPLLIDVDPRTFNLDPDDFRRRLRTGTKAVILPHMFGLPADATPIRQLGVPVIEDGALAMGSESVGSVGRLTVLSFYATKMMTTGEGGMVLGDAAKRLQLVRDLRSYDGRKRHRQRFNYKMADLQAALGRAQLKRLRSLVRARRRLASFYSAELEQGPWELPPRNAKHVYYRFVIRTHLPATVFLRELNALGVDARRPVFKPLHGLLGFTGFPGSEEAHRHAVSLPLYPALRRAEAERVVRATQRVGQHG